MTPAVTPREVPLSFSERRTSERVPVALQARCKVGRFHLAERIADISLTGFYLRTTEAVITGSEVHASVGIPVSEGYRVCHLVGHVARVDRDEHGRTRGIGVELDLTEVPWLDLYALQEFVEMRGYGLTLPGKR